LEAVLVQHCSGLAVLFFLIIILLKFPDLKITDHAGSAMTEELNVVVWGFALERATPHFLSPLAGISPLLEKFRDQQHSVGDDLRTKLITHLTTGRKRNIEMNETINEKFRKRPGFLFEWMSFRTADRGGWSLRVKSGRTTITVGRCPV